MKERLTTTALLQLRTILAETITEGSLLLRGDSRNRRVPGLYTRNGRFYCQLWVDQSGASKTARRFALVNAGNAPVRSLQEAKAALEIKRHERRENALPTAGRKPSFAEFSETYFGKAKVQGKRAGTLQNERQSVARWCEHLGHVRVDRISTALISSYIDKRLRGGVFRSRNLPPVTARTANLDLLMLRNVMKAAMDDGHLRELPKMRALEAPPPRKRGLLNPAEFERLIAAPREACAKNGKQLADYLRFLAFSGVREQEALRIKWDNVDFERERITIGADGLAKTARCGQWSSTLLSAPSCAKCTRAVPRIVHGCFLRPSAGLAICTLAAFVKA